MKLLGLTAILSAGVWLLSGCSPGEPLLSARSTQSKAAIAVSDPMENLIAARQLAWEAAVMVQHPPHAVHTWQAAQVRWRRAIRLLEAIPDGTPISSEAKAKLAVYQRNYDAISHRLSTEQTALDNLKTAQALAWQAAVTVQNPPDGLADWQRSSRKWQAAIARLKPIPPTVSIASKAKQKLIVYRRNDQQITQRLINETTAVALVRQFSAIAAQLSHLSDTALTSLTVEQVGIRYEDYAKQVNQLEALLTQFGNQPDAKNHRLYAPLKAAMVDYQVALRLWQTYLAFRQANAQWLHGEDFFNQLMPVPVGDRALLFQKYRVPTYLNGTKVSLKFSVWQIWEHAAEQVKQAQSKVG